MLIVPNYLKPYCKDQDFDAYTPREHATWRYIMRRNLDFFSQHAVPAYVQGLKVTGIPIDRIPRISEIDECLRRFGWGAVGVSGFIPPAAFLDFQSRRIMPIAMDMRTLEHMAYTPAPDIVHEAAGHVPILCDGDFRAYLESYALMAKNSITSDEDIRLYEAIRQLSDIKENPDATAPMVKLATKRLEEATQGITFVSEQAMVARMNWWTAEYGLVGDMNRPLIYGAGLLSSVGESEHCLSSEVTKMPLSIRCTEQSYDITEPQPQLFVAQNMASLSTVLAELETQMAYHHGGTLGLDKAKRAKTVTTVVLDSGIAASGILSDFSVNLTSSWLKFDGAVQLSIEGQEIPEHGRLRHPAGFSSPVGYWKIKDTTFPQALEPSFLTALGISKGKLAHLVLVDDTEIKGTVTDLHRHNGRLVMISWINCTVTRKRQIVFHPDWGEFDMLVGTRITRVYGGPGDPEKFGDYALGTVSSTASRSSPFSRQETERFELYRRLRYLRESGNVAISEIETMAREIIAAHRSEWLLAIELLEVTSRYRPEHGLSDLTDSVRSALADVKERDLFEKALKTYRWMASTKQTVRP